MTFVGSYKSFSGSLEKYDTITDLRSNEDDCCNDSDSRQKGAKSDMFVMINLVGSTEIRKLYSNGSWP